MSANLTPEDFDCWRSETWRNPRDKRRWRVQFPADRRFIKTLAEEFLAAGPQALQVLSATHNAAVEIYRFADGRRYIVKHYRPRSTFDAVKRRFLPSRAIRSRDGARTLLAAGFAAVEPCCVIEAAGESFAVFEPWPEWISLREWLRTAPGPAGLKLRLRAAAFLGEELGKMHRRGIFHPDVNLGNVLVRWEGAVPRFAWLDTEGVRRGHSVALGRRANNLKQLAKLRRAANAGERRAFVEHYLRASGTSPETAARLLALALAKTKENLRRYRSQL